MKHPIKGIHVLLIFGLAFGAVICANLTLALSAVRTFPGLEVKNSYVASQSFEAERAAQLALGWQVTTLVHDGKLVLTIHKDGKPIRPVIESALFGRATSIAHDQKLDFIFKNAAFHAPIIVTPGNWNLRLRARGANGALFAQRIVVEVPK